MSFYDQVANIQKVIEDARTQAKNAFMAELKDFFARNQDIKAIVWTQYTPYFNDGDTCEFRVNDICASNYEDVSHYGEWESEDPTPADLMVYESYGRPGYTRELRELNDFMQSNLGEEVLQFAFGDHVSIRVTANGITIDEYEHD